MNKQAITKRETDPSNLARAFQELSDGIVTLLRQHLELFREEAKRDARVFSKQASFIAAGALSIAFGYALFWIAASGVAYVLWGAVAASVGLLTVSGLHLIFGIVFVRGGLRRIQEQRRDALASAKLELEKSSQWVKQISKDNSSEPTAPSS